MIGDWLVYGEHTYGEMYAQALDATGFSYGTLANQVYVAQRFDFSRRRENLSFSHHQEVAALPPEEADELLDRADPTTNESGQAMPRESFRAMVRAHNVHAGRAVVTPRPGSVTESDSEALVTLISIHAAANPRIIDVCCNDGSMWSGTGYGVTRVDIDPVFKDMGLADVTADCRALPFPDGSFDVVVFDPPHVTDTGTGSILGMRYGSLEGDNISDLFAPFLHEAHRVLSDGGIVLAKIADAVHAQAQQWQHVDFLLDAENENFTPCDAMIKVRNTEISGEWINVFHVRKMHCYWLVVRKGDSCQRVAQR